MIVVLVVFTTDSPIVSVPRHPLTHTHHLCVRKEPRSGTMEELLSYEEIDAEAIVKTIFL